MEKVIFALQWAQELRSTAAVVVDNSEVEARSTVAEEAAVVEGVGSAVEGVGSSLSLGLRWRVPAGCPQCMVGLGLVAEEEVDIAGEAAGRVGVRIAVAVAAVGTIVETAVYIEHEGH